eukprot:GHVP01059559.1.p1 GENE.GHVP01059559.1~~GHVP01059559.1.p1  ORF type:complete len:348 (+),score=38.55 GHVP01059559.1:38-1045(+)
MKNSEQKLPFALLLCEAAYLPGTNFILLEAQDCNSIQSVYFSVEDSKVVLNLTVDRTNVENFVPEIDNTTLNDVQNTFEPDFVYQIDAPSGGDLEVPAELRIFGSSDKLLKTLVELVNLGDYETTSLPNGKFVISPSVSNSSPWFDWFHISMVLVGGRKYFQYVIKRPGDSTRAYFVDVSPRDSLRESGAGDSLIYNQKTYSFYRGSDALIQHLSDMSEKETDTKRVTFSDSAMSATQSEKTEEVKPKESKGKKPRSSKRKDKRPEEKNNNTLIAVLITSVISVVFVGGYFVATTSGASQTEPSSQIVQNSLMLKNGTVRLKIIIYIKFIILMHI